MLVAIEGIDGAGKGTQSELLLNLAHDRGYTAKLISFPRYQATKSSQLITAYLNGEFGKIHEVSPQFAATLFALERLESREYVKKMCEEYELVIVDRYVASNLAYQSARFADPDDRSTFMDWLIDLEYGTYKLPVPNLSVFLNVPVDTSQKLVAQKETRSYTQDVYDLHEGNAAYLSAVLDVYTWLFEESFYVEPSAIINCEDQWGALRGAENIKKELEDIVLGELLYYL